MEWSRLIPLCFWFHHPGQGHVELDVQIEEFPLYEKLRFQFLWRAFLFGLVCHACKKMELLMEGVGVVPLLMR